MPYYKIVYKKGHSLISTNALLPSAWQVTYKPGEWAEAPGNSYLFVFASLEQAKQHWPAYDPYYSIWECETENPAPLMRRCLTLGSLSDLQIFWNLPHRRGYLMSALTPAGTCFFKRVKLTKQIFPSLDPSPQTPE